MITLCPAFRKPLLVILLGSVLSFLLLTAARRSGALEFLELETYDWFVRMAAPGVSAEARVTLIEISEDDIQSLGQWPLSDATIAGALKKLLAQQPRAVGLDIYRDMPIPPGREELSRLFVEHPNLIGIMTVGEKGIAPLPAISGTEQEAFNDIVVDPGGVVRRGLLFLDDGETVYSSFALRMALLYLAQEGIYPAPDPQNPEHLRLNRVTLRPLEANDGGYAGVDAAGYQFLLDYRSGRKPVQSFSLTQLLAGEVPASAVSDKLILVGVSATSVKDDFYTPLSRGMVEQQQVPGIVLHGQILSQLLRFALDDTPQIATLNAGQRHAWLLAWSLMGAVVGYRTRSAWRFFSLLFAGLAVLLGMTYYAFLQYLWTPAVPPSLTFALAAGGVTAYITGLEKRERAALMRIFSKYVSKEVAEMIWRQKDQFLDNGRPRSENMLVTVFFSDLQNFTTVSEQLTPKELIDWLNTYLEPMSELIMKYGGVVDSYSGDGIKADFGVPIPRSEDAQIRADAMNAINCALEMEQELERLNQEWQAKGYPAVGARIGIYTGPVVGGLLGSANRLKYTTLGDTVNIASRLESYDRGFGRDLRCRILIGDTTAAYLPAHIQTREVGEVSLKGKQEKVLVFQVLGEALSNSEHPGRSDDEIQRNDLVAGLDAGTGSYGLQR